MIKLLTKKLRKCIIVGNNYRKTHNLSRAFMALLKKNSMSRNDFVSKIFIFTQTFVKADRDWMAKNT